MSKGSLALTDILTALRDGADYDAICAVVMASEGGRWFLSEFANRNRHADTQMLVDALARVEAAIRGEAAPQAAVRSQSVEPPQPSALQIAVPPQIESLPQISAPASCRDLIEIAA